MYNYRVLLITCELGILEKIYTEDKFISAPVQKPKAGQVFLYKAIKEDI